MSEEIAKSKMCCPCRVIEARVKELEAYLKSCEVGDIGVHDEVVNKQLVNFSEKMLCVEQEFQNFKQEHEGVKSWVNSIENLFELLNVTRDGVKISIAIQVELYELVQGDMDVESYIAKFEELCLNGNNNDLNEVLVMRFLNGLNSCYKDDVSVTGEKDLYRAYQRVMLLELRKNRAIWKKCNDNLREQGVALKYTPHCVESNVDHAFRTIGAMDWVENLIVAIDGGSSTNCISEEFVRVNHLEVDLRIGDLVSSESLDIVPMTACDIVLSLPFIKKLGMVIVGSLNVFSYRDHENRLVELRSLSPWENEHIMFKRRKDKQKVFLSVGGPRLFPFKNRRKFAVRTWTSLKEYSPTPSSGNNEVEGKSLNHQQVSEESSGDFPSKWNDSSDEDSSDVQDIDASEFVPKSKRLEEIEDTHSSV
ncbi:OLC1v1024507C1 [Oldenlandia corymbosa var. corymbosa]|uniref:OLC1v1024507C1 n=1 Tax=Oldenlandia corymbosa var. corymbosa TaxID=529605 RepID=A0AAV1C4A1_OLDCO|nr:OLC1v1024507C1 [Oldenlandia corymbosa var. corymbosa]